MENVNATACKSAFYINPKCKCCVQDSLDACSFFATFSSQLNFFACYVFVFCFAESKPNHTGVIFSMCFKEKRTRKRQEFPIDTNTCHVIRLSSDKRIKMRSAFQSKNGRSFAITETVCVHNSPHLEQVVVESVVDGHGVALTPRLGRRVVILWFQLNGARHAPEYPQNSFQHHASIHLQENGCYCMTKCDTEVECTMNSESEKSAAKGLVCLIKRGFSFSKITFYEGTVWSKTSGERSLEKQQK